VDQDVSDAARIGVLEDDRAVSTEREHPVGVVKRREPAGELESRIDEDADCFLELGLGGAAHDHQSHGATASGRDSTVKVFL